MERTFNNVKITSSFEMPETRENLVSGETIGQHFGKIAKVIDDLENGEFSCNLTIDDTLSETSKNPVQNKVVNAALKSKADQTTVDNALAQKANLEYVNTSLTGKSDIGHTHDDRYYTESEIDTKLNTKLNISLKGAVSGLAELDSSGKVPSSQLPSYVDDVLEYANQSSFPAKGESGKIYIAQDTNKTYRWSGSTYIEISPSLALGETSATAYRGDRGKVAYDHSQTAHAPSDAQANVIETIKVNGTALTPSSKAVDITVPSVGNGTITITQNGTTKGTFTTNQSGNTTIALTDNNTTYGVATSSALGLVKSGTDITVDSSGNVSVNDDSHNHVISNVDGLQSALDGKAASTHTHDDRYYTESEVDTKLNGKANTSHGNHVPATQTANNAVFLRNDNTWQTVTPANIGAAASSHTHSAYVNQNAFSNVVVGSTTVAADTTTDTLTLVGSNVTLTPDATNDKITIGITKNNVTAALGYTPPTTNTTYSAMTGATSSAAGTSGLVPAPAAGKQASYLRGDGTWAVPPDTKYSAMIGATSSAAGRSGIVPAPAAGKQASYLRGDGTWAVPPDTDTKVTNTLNKTAKAYVTGTTSASTNTGTQVFDTGVYLDTTAGMLTATTFKGALSGNASTSNKLKSTSYITISITTSDWSTNSSGGYVCTKTLSSAMAYTNFNFDVVLSTDQSAAKLQIESWNNVIADGEITQTTSSGSTTAFTFYAFTTKPSVALTVGIQGVS